MNLKKTLIAALLIFGVLSIDVEKEESAEFKAELEQLLEGSNLTTG
jgi:hypothetical protein